MAIDDSRIDEYIDIFKELSELAGGMEKTSIFPNLEVIDANPTVLGSNYVIIRDESNFYTPALKVPGVSYSDGDFVNVLYIKGTEPIAFQQGSMSSSVPAAGAWPVPNKINIGTSVYSTISAAFTAAVADSYIQIAEGTFPAGAALTFTEAAYINGRGNATIITGSAYPVLTIETGYASSNFQVEASGGSGTDAIAIRCTATWYRVSAIADGTGGFTNAVAFECEASGGSLIECNGTANAATNNYALHITGGTWLIRGGVFTGKVLIDVGATVTLDNPIITSTFTNNGTCYGNYLDNSGNIIDVNLTASRAVVTGTSKELASSATTAAQIGYLSSLTSDVQTQINAIVSVSGKVWKITGQTITTYTTLALAIAALADGDTLFLFNGTYSEYNTISNNSITLIGFGAAISNSTSPLTVTGTGFTIRNLTVICTSNALLSYCVYGNANNLTMQNCILTKTGAGTNAYGIYHDGGTGWRLTDTIISCSGATNNYGYGATNAAAECSIIDGSISGTTQDLYTTVAATLTLNNVKLVNNLVSWAGTKLGSYNTSGNTVVFGNVYLTTAKDIYPSNDVFGLWQRLINYGLTPIEHWSQNADQITWTGWKAYVGFVTPSLLSITNSIYTAGYATGAAKWFRYRAASTGAHIALKCRVAVTYIASGGVMLDNNVDGGDGNGATSFYRCYVESTALGGVVTIKEQYRSGGGGITTNTMTPNIPPGQFGGIGLLTVGTRWSNWNCYLINYGEYGQSVMSIASSGFNWTPVNVGLFGAGTAADAGRQSKWDWYTEDTS